MPCKFAKCNLPRTSSKLSLASAEVKIEYVNKAERRHSIDIMRLISSAFCLPFIRVNSVMIFEKRNDYDSRGFILCGYVHTLGEKLKAAKAEDENDEGKSEDSEREGDSDKEDSKRKRKRADDGTKDDAKTDEKLSTPSGSSTTSQGTNGSTSPDMKRRRLAESPLTSNAEVCSSSLFGML